MFLAPSSRSEIVEDIQKLQGAWRFIFEEAELGADTPIWVFMGARVIEIAKTQREGHCEPVQGGVRVTLPADQGPMLVTLRIDQGQESPTCVRGNYFESIGDFDLETYCTLLRIPAGEGGGEPLLKELDVGLPIAA